LGARWSLPLGRRAVGRPVATVVSLEQRRRRGFYWAFAGVGHVVLSLPDGTEHLLTPKRARLLASALQTIADTVEAEGSRG
jgi:hypothetical protein